MSTQTSKGTEYRHPEFVRGDTYELDLTFREGDPNTGPPLDFTGDSWRLTIRHGKTDAVIAALTSDDGDIILDYVTPGRLYATVANDVTQGWPLGFHKIDLERTTSEGKVKTFLRGFIPVTEDQSR